MNHEGRKWNGNVQHLFLVQPKCSKEALAMLGLTAGLLFNKLQFSEWIMDFTFTIATQRVLTRAILNQMVFYVNMKPVTVHRSFFYREEEDSVFILFMPFMFKSSHHTPTSSFSFENVNRNYQD